VARDGLYRVQTPQMFHFETIMRAHRETPADAPVTDDAGMLRALSVPVAMVARIASSFKDVAPSNEGFT